VCIRAVNLSEGLKLNEIPTLIFEFSGTRNEVDEQIKCVEEISQKNKGSGFRYAKNDEVSLWFHQIQRVSIPCVNLISK
jgi:hypothetical protein